MKKLSTIIFLLVSVVLFSQFKGELKDWVANPEKGETAATFPKGMEVFRQLILENFRMKKIKSKEELSCVISFIVDNRGKVTYIEAVGSNLDFNNEAKRAVSKIKTKWKPAEIRRHKVRYFISIPVNIKFE